MMDPLLIPLAALAIPIVVGPVAIRSKYAQRVRELEHAERMRALELGQAIPLKESRRTPARMVVLIGGVVPIWSMGLAGFIDWFGGGRRELWEACSIVAGIGLLCGTYLAGRYLFSRATVDEPAAKPHYDPEAFDFAGSRG